MSFNVLVIPEDATMDRYVLEPLIRSVVTAAGRPRAVVRVLSDPAAHGVDQVLKPNFLRQVLFRNPMTSLFLLCVDRDGKPGRGKELEHREAVVREHLRPDQHLLGTAAHQEVEAWCLAGMDDLPRQWSWEDVRSETSCKEVYFERYARGRGLLDAVGDGRGVLGPQAARRYDRVRKLCPEVAELEERVRALA